MLPPCIVLHIAGKKFRFVQQSRTDARQTLRLSHDFECQTPNPKRMNAKSKHMNAIHILLMKRPSWNFHFSRMNSNLYRRMIQGNVNCTPLYLCTEHWSHEQLCLLRLRFNHFEIKSAISLVPILSIPFAFEQTLSTMMTMTYYFSAKNVDERILGKSLI